jgi:hypothetical protein
MTQGDCCPIDGHKVFTVEFVNGKVMYRCIWCDTRWCPEQLVLNRPMVGGL